MKLKFANDQVTEYASGNFHVKNDGNAFEVDAGFGAELLKAKHYLDGEYVDVFEQASPSEASTQPDTVESLAKLGREKLEAIAKDAGLDGDGYTNKKELAAAIIAAKGE